MSIKGKVAIVTGAAQGVGRACVEHFVAEGANVVLADVNEELGEQLVTELAVDEAKFVTCNVTERLDVRNLVAHTIETFGSIDILINSARLVDNIPFLELTEEQFEKVILANLKGTFLVSQVVASRMVEQIKKGGAPGNIVNMSSIHAVYGASDHVAYSASKGGINQLTKSMAIALARYSIRVNAIAPGSINTPSLEPIAPDGMTLQSLMTRTPLGRLGEPGEIASIASFLASESASYVTGEIIYADGGRLALNGNMSNEEEVK